MDTKNHIQLIKSQIMNMKLQIDNIEFQNNNRMGSMIDDGQIGEQLFNLSMQMFNTGIQAFNTGKNISNFSKLEKYIKQIKQISKQINSIISDYNNESQKQQQMQQMQQWQQMQQMLQMQQIEQMVDQEEMEKEETKKITFKSIKGEEKIITVKFGTTMEELLNKYIYQVYGLTYKKLTFLYNAQTINRNDQREVVNDYFKNCENPTILVLERS